MGVPGAVIASSAYLFWSLFDMCLSGTYIYSKVSHSRWFGSLSFVCTASPYSISSDMVLCSLGWKPRRFVQKGISCLFLPEKYDPTCCSMSPAIACSQNKQNNSTTQSSRIHYTVMSAAVDQEISPKAGTSLLPRLLSRTLVVT